MEKYHIPIYSAEQDISSEIAKASIGMECQIIPGNPCKNFSFQKALAELYPSYASDQFDLFPVYSLLVSTGWNKNTDVFLKSEIYHSFNSPINKPFNVEHIPNKIIGHMTSSLLVDNDYNPIDMGLPIDTIPDDLNILTTSVIYRHIKSRDPQWEEQVAKWIEEIKNGDWYVSMEVLFKSFDYALMNSDGVERIVGRDKDTAHMTKSLVFYGGNGTYNGEKIGRVLRYMVFSGQGLVRRPANQKSVISSDPGVFNNIFGSANIIKENIEKMAEDNNVKLEAELAEVKAKLAETEAQLNTAKASEAELVTVKADLQKIQALSEHKDGTITELTSKIAKSEASIKELEKAKAEVETTLVKTTEELNTLKLQALKDSRATKLRSSADFTDDEVKDILDKCMSLSDEQFDTFVSTLAKKCKKEVAKCGDEEDKKGEAAAASTNLETVEVEKDATLANDGVDNEQIQQSKAHLVGYLSHLLNSKKK